MFFFVKKKKTQPCLKKRIAYRREQTIGQKLVHGFLLRHIQQIRLMAYGLTWANGFMLWHILATPRIHANWRPEGPNKHVSMVCFQRPPRGGDVPRRLPEQRYRCSGECLVVKHSSKVFGFLWIASDARYTREGVPCHRAAQKLFCLPVRKGGQPTRHESLSSMVANRPST